MFKNKFRWAIILTISILMVINFVDRVVISLATEPIMKEFGFSASQWGWILGAFFWGLVPFSFIAGIGSDKLGPKKIFSLGAFIWSVFTLATVGAWNFITLFIARVFFGVGESPTGSNSIKVITNWVSPKEYSTAYGLTFGGVFLGPAIAAPILGWMIVEFGWRSPFYVLGGLGLLWLIVWAKIFTDRPEQNKYVSESEKSWILNEQQRQKEPAENIKQKSIKELFSIPKGVRTTIVANWWAAFCFGYALYFLFTWLPGYLNIQRGINLASMGWALMIPYLGAALGIMGGGRISDYILEKTGSRRIARGYWCSGSFLIATIGLFFSVRVDSFILAITVLTIAWTALASAGGVVGPVLAETLPGQAGVQGGILFVFQTLPGIIAPVVTGYIVDATQSFNNAFYLASFILLSGVITTFLFLRPPYKNVDTRLEEEFTLVNH